VTVNQNRQQDVSEYELTLVSPHGSRTESFASDRPLGPGEVVELRGRTWLVDRQEEGDGNRPRLVAFPARYRVVLQHEDGQEEFGALRRLGDGAPGLGHAFTTTLEGAPVAWQVVELRLVHDPDGLPLLELVAERDFSEVEGLPDHDLEHRRSRSEELSAAAETTLDRAANQGLLLELVGLDPGRVPDWEAAAHFIDSLIFEEVAEGLLELAGIQAGDLPHDRELELLKQRLHEDLDRFRADVESDRDQIEEWDLHGLRVFASTGTWADQFDPDHGHGWMVRLVDSGALGAAGFQRIRKTEL
jgi:hypothetical protein